MRYAPLCGFLIVVAFALAWPSHADRRPERGPLPLAVAVAQAIGPAEVATGFTAGRGRVITVAHVLDEAGAGGITVRPHGGAARSAHVLRVDREDDLAILAVPGLQGPALRLASGAGAVRMLVWRARGSVPARVRRPIVAGVRTGGRVTRRPALELAARVEGGDSGAAVVESDGRVVGVLFARSLRRPGTAYAVASSALRTLLRRGGPGDAAGIE